MRVVALAAFFLLATALLPAASADVSFFGVLGSTGASDTGECATDPPVYADDGRGDPYYCILGTYVPGVCLAFCDGSSPEQELAYLVYTVEGAVDGDQQSYCVEGSSPFPDACLVVGGNCQDHDPLKNSVADFVRCFAGGTGVHH
jgi:hypothetical protein